MEGIRYMVDEQGQRVAVVIDLKRYGDLWEDFYDTLLAYERANEPRETLHEVKERLHKLGKIIAIRHRSDVYDN